MAMLFWPETVVRLPTAPRGNFTVDAEGERLLFYSMPGDTNQEGRSDRLMVVLNWFEELKQRVPVDR